MTQESIVFTVCGEGTKRDCHKLLTAALLNLFENVTLVASHAPGTSFFCNTRKKTRGGGDKSESEERKMEEKLRQELPQASHCLCPWDGNISQENSPRSGQGFYWQCLLIIFSLLKNNGLHSCIFHPIPVRTP